MAHLVVVGTDQGSVFSGTGLALKDDDGDALVVGAVNSGRNGLHLIGGHNKQVDAALYQRVNLLHLALVAVVGCGEFQFHIALEIGAHAQFGILLFAPDVGRALRYADGVFRLFLLVASGQQQQ